MSSLTYYHGDHLGSAAFITDDGGYVLHELRYLPYGGTLRSLCLKEYNERFRFTGQEYDPESGYYKLTYVEDGLRLSNNRERYCIRLAPSFDARYYNPGTALFDESCGLEWLPDSRDFDILRHFASYGPGWLSPDPLFDQFPTTNPYAYCGWNPMAYVDPNGREKVKIGVSFTLTTGRLGLGYGKILRFHINSDFVAKVGISAYAFYDFNKKNVGVGIEHKTTYETDNDFFYVSYLGISHEEHKERNVIHGINTQDGVLHEEENVYHSVENTNLKNLSIEHGDNERLSSSSFDIGPEVNAGIIGVEAKAGIKYEP